MLGEPAGVHVEGGDLVQLRQVEHRGPAGATVWTLDDLADGGAMLAVVAVLSVVAAALVVDVVRRIGAWQSAPGFFTPPADDPRWQRPE
ncbi:hypothetical protein B0I31_112134 [Saccharothrix carnea]|uniref:Uncharacterized protein n=1 Tax=Saccharothrix carnea TaxID=1280637 RepID=A0A2P8I2J9_SACCR|nr:hypothetical protein [Saccharothrix carnea]PSL52665.1 hypothetical protein B0I31_112134 [Saccharothrix carnea]